MHRDAAQYEQALEALGRALTLDPRSVKALGARAALRIDIGNLNGASSDVKTLLGIAQSEPEDARLGHLKRKYGFQLSDVRRAVARRSQISTGRE